MQLEPTDKTKNESGLPMRMVVSCGQDGNVERNLSDAKDVDERQE